MLAGKNFLNLSEAIHHLPSNPIFKIDSII